MTSGLSPGVVREWDDTSTGNRYRLIWTGIKSELQWGWSEYGCEPKDWHRLDPDDALSVIAEYLAR